jgi:hypothetical protein
MEQFIPATQGYDTAMERRVMALLFLHFMAGLVETQVIACLVDRRTG